MKDLIESNKSSGKIVKELTEASGWSRDTYHGDDFTALYKEREGKLEIINDMEDVGSPTTGPDLSLGGPGQFENVSSRQDAENIVKELEKAGNLDHNTAEKIAKNNNAKWNDGGNLPF